MAHITSVHIPLTLVHLIVQKAEKSYSLTAKEAGKYSLTAKEAGKCSLAQEEKEVVMVKYLSMWAKG